MSAEAVSSQIGGVVLVNGIAGVNRSQEVMEVEIRSGMCNNSFACWRKSQSSWSCQSIHLHVGVNRINDCHVGVNRSRDSHGTRVLHSTCCSGDQKAGR